VAREDAQAVALAEELSAQLGRMKAPGRTRAGWRLSRYSCDTHVMSKRLQVILDEQELSELREAARREGLPVSEWVRRTLREARSRQPGRDVDSKLRAVRTAVKHEGPTADIDDMLAEIERGYGRRLPE
jgi:hypothetical protein